MKLGDRREACAVRGAPLCVAFANAALRSLCLPEPRPGHPRGRQAQPLRSASGSPTHERAAAQDCPACGSSYVRQRDCASTSNRTDFRRGTGPDSELSPPSTPTPLRCRSVNRSTAWRLTLRSVPVVEIRRQAGDAPSVTPHAGAMKPARLRPLARVEFANGSSAAWLRLVRRRMPPQFSAPFSGP